MQKETLQNLLKNHRWFLLIFCIFVFSFYWFEYRPQSIRTSCKKDVMNSEDGIVEEWERKSLNYDMTKIDKIEMERSTFWYKDCLNNKGLEN